MENIDLASLIGGDATGSPGAEQPAPTPEATPPSDGPARDAEGRFAAKPAEAEQPAPFNIATAADIAPGHVPISAMLDEREKRQALERQLADIQAERQRAEAQAKAADLPPDVRTAQQMWGLRMDLSRELMVSQHGEEEARALHEWGEAKCGSDPHFNQQVYASKNPYAFIRQARQREMLLAEVSPDDLDDYKAWKASKAQGASPAPTPGATPSPAPTPPRSLANAPNAGGAGAVAETPMGPGAAFNQTIRR
jgi:hypothetical protein